MTEALDAMVKAMHAEIERQNEGPGATGHGYVGDLRSEVEGGTVVDCNVDLEKVARAGLAAIRRPTIDDALAATDDFDIYWSYKADGRPGGPEDVFAAIVDAILAPPAKDDARQEN